MEDAGARGDPVFTVVFMEVVSDDGYFLTGAKDLTGANGDNREGNSLFSPFVCDLSPHVQSMS